MTEGGLILAPIVFLIALVYSSVGLGGGSSYVAVFSLFGMPLTKIPPIALFLNIVVASISLARFNKHGYVKPNVILPLLAASLPATYLGARWRPDERILSLVFALVLISISFLLFFRFKSATHKFRSSASHSWQLSLLLGAMLGFLAGVMGIGGGIFLGPVLLVIGFSSTKHVAGICSAFVLSNSLIGLATHFLYGNVNLASLLLLGIAVFLGGLIGSLVGVRIVSPSLLRRVVAVLLFFVSIKLAMGALI